MKKTNPRHPHTIYDIGFEKARSLALEHMPRMDSEPCPITEAAGRICVADCLARVDSPSVNASTRDGYAVIGDDLATASQADPVVLTIAGRVAAGSHSPAAVSPGSTVRILTGAPIPDGADAVLADEVVTVGERCIHARTSASPGKNIIPKGTDLAMGDLLAKAGQKITPPLAGLLAAGGIDTVSVRKRPKIGLLATGSEVVLPGRPLKTGELYASNVVMVDGWLQAETFPTTVHHAADREDDIDRALTDLLNDCDAVITSGGAWKGDRDITISALERLGWKRVFQRVRMGPGKGVSLGLIGSKPVFCLPGGPTSNEVAFLMIAFPALHRMAGYSHTPHLYLEGRLEKTIHGQSDWTQFIECQIVRGDAGVNLRPIRMKSRLVSMARADAIVRIPEGREIIPAGELLPYLCLNPHHASTTLRS